MKLLTQFQMIASQFHVNSINWVIVCRFKVVLLREMNSILFYWRESFPKDTIVIDIDDSLVEFIQWNKKLTNYREAILLTLTRYVRGIELSINVEVDTSETFPWLKTIQHSRFTIYSCLFDEQEDQCWKILYTYQLLLSLSNICWKKSYMCQWHIDKIS